MMNEKITDRVFTHFTNITLQRRKSSTRIENNGLHWARFDSDRSSLKVY